MRCCIITIGNEIIQGRIVDTNSAFLARKLSILGHEIRAKISVGDSHELIAKALSTCLDTFGCDLIITTGGLGPTPDDITLEAIARALGLELTLNEEALKEIERKYREKGLEMTEARKKMALMPRGAKPIPNPVGIAPGALIETYVGGRKILIVALPGVPREMESMFSSFVEKMLRLPNRFLIEAYIDLLNARESDLAPLIKELQKRYPEFYIKSHPMGHEIEKPSILLYISTYDSDKQRGISRCIDLLKALETKLREALPHVEVKIRTPCTSQ